MARKTGLGRGLGALIPEGEPAEITETPTAVVGPLQEIALSAIRPNQFQPRQSFEDEPLKALAESIKGVGVIQPILVRPVEGESDAFEIVAGERRWRASRIAGLETIPAFVQTDVNDTLSLERAIVENLHRVDLNALEEAAAYQQLIDDFSFTHDQIATRVGKNRATISNTLRLLNLGSTAQKAVMTGSISAGHARALLGIADFERQDSLVKKITDGELSVRATEELVKETLVLKPTPTPTSATAGGAAPTKPILRPVPDAAIVELEHLLEELLDTRVHIDLKGKTGRMVIDFADLGDLERIYLAMVKSK
jgi:ParB family transcriptional regulator, chromosome partitioning protein